MKVTVPAHLYTALTTAAAVLAILLGHEATARKEFNKQSVLKEARPRLEGMCADFAKLAYMLRAAEEKTAQLTCLESDQIPAEAMAEVMNGFLKDCTDVLVGRLAVKVGPRKKTELDISTGELSAIFLKSYQPQFDAFCDKNSRSTEAFGPAAIEPASAASDYDSAAVTW